MSANPLSLSAELHAAVREAVAAVRGHVANPDAKVSLKAMAELARLMAMCERMGIELPSADPTPMPSPRPAAQSETIRQKKVDTLTAVFTPRADEPAPLPPPPPLPGGGKQLHSFLGTPKPAAPIRPPSSG
jgi:hypothetical protein